MDSTQPAAISRTIISRPQQSVVITSKQAFPNMVSGTASPDSRVYVYPLSTYMGGAGTWIYNVSLNYSRFRFRKLKFHYIPSCATTATGQVSLGIGYDMGDFFPQSLGGINTAGNNYVTDYTGDTVSMQPSVNAPAWQPVSVEVPIEKFGVNKVASAADYGVGTTITDALQRNWFSDGYLLAVASFSPTVTIGRVVCEFEIELIDPIPSSFNA